MTFINNFAFHLTQVWQTHYVFLIAVSLLLGLLLLRFARGIRLFTALMLALFLLLILTSALAGAMGASSVATVVHAFGILTLGLLIIRQTALLLFRRVVPKLGLTPPRILEELLILLAYVVWVLIRLSYAGLDPSSLVASTAVITAVIAFAMQDTLGNILAGLALQMDRSVNIGDWVEVQDDIRGQVVQVQWRHTAIETLFREVVLIPNSHLMKGNVKIVGGTSVPKRRNSVFFYADFSLDPSVVIETVEEALLRVELDGIDNSEGVICQVLDFANGFSTYAVRYWLTDPRAIGSSSSLLRRHIYAIFQRNGWHFSAPGMDLSVVSKRSKYVQHSQHGLEEKVQILRKLSLFDPLTQAELSDLASKLTTMPFVSGSVLVKQGEVGTSLLVIAQGSADVWLEQGATRHRVAKVGESEIVGEMCLMTGEPRRATVIASTHLICYEMHKSDFEKILKQRPELAETFAQLLAQRSEELARLRDNAKSPVSVVQRNVMLAKMRDWFGL